MTREAMLPLAAEAGLALRCTQDAFALLERAFARRVVAFVALGKALVIAVLVCYPRDPLGALLAPLLHAIGGEAGPHYPAAYGLFPRALSMLDPILDLALGLPWIVALLAALPALLAGNDKPVGAHRGRRFPAALLGALPGALVGVAAPTVGDRVGTAMFGMVGMALGFALTAAGLALASAFAFTVPGVVIGRLSLPAALARSFATAGRFPRLTVAVLLLETVVAGLFRPAPRMVAMLFEPLNPESVFLILAIGAVVIAWVEVLRSLVLGRLYLHVWGAEIS